VSHGANGYIITIHLKELGHEQVEWSDLLKGRDYFIGAEEELSSTDGDHGRKE
jgi:hypothetical protein